MLYTRIGSSYSVSNFPEQFSNQLYFSENSALGGYRYQSPYSLKYILRGYESYDVEGREIVIDSQQFLLVNNGSEVTALEAEGAAFSIFIAPETLSDVASLLSSKSIDENLEYPEGWQSPPLLFPEIAHDPIKSRTTTLLQNIKQLLTKGTLKGQYNTEPSLFFQLSEALILDQKPHLLRIKKLNSLKASTVQEQYSRLLMGHAYLHDNWNKPFSLKATASAAMLSPFHFHRLFKTCFSVTPYHYHLKVQMSKALNLLKEKQHSITEIAFLLGFNSSTSFGRSFKKYFGHSPTLYTAHIEN